MNCVAFLFAYFSMHAYNNVKCLFFCGLLKLNIKTFKALFFVHYRHFQALIREQETRNLTLHSAAPRAVLNFLFLVREFVLEMPIMHSKSAVILNYYSVFVN